MDPSPRRDDYTVACLCPMGVELAAMEGMLDEINESVSSSRDTGAYTLGRMGVHNVVVDVMPETGNNRAAVVATKLLNDFPSIRFGSLVGIGGGIPGEDEDDIRLPTSQSDKRDHETAFQAWKRDVNGRIQSLISHQREIQQKQRKTTAASDLEQLPRRNQET